MVSAIERAKRQRFNQENRKGGKNQNKFLRSCFPERFSDLSRIVGPMKQRLALPATANEIARFTVFF
jgi:hypothetical protein